MATQVNQSTDCLTWGAVIVKTEVQDQDGDGLLDVWEEPWKVDPATSKPVYRFYRPKGGSHFYTIDADERDRVQKTYSRVYTYEGVAFYAFQ